MGHNHNSVKLMIDREVAARLGVNRKLVSSITYEFIEEIRRLIVMEGRLVVARLGTFSVRNFKVDRDVVRLNSSRPLSSEERNNRFHVSRTAKRVYFAKGTALSKELEDGKARR